MDFRLFNLKLSPLLAVAALMAASSIEAQPSTTNAWKPIIFSSPNNSEVSSNVTSLSTRPATSSDFRSLFQDASPVPSFNDFSSGPAPMPSEGGRFIRSSDQRQDWVFMTPAEIMGVTPEKMFNLSKQGADSQGEESLTPMERYLVRQNQPATTNSYFSSPGNSFSPQGFWGDGNNATNGVSFSPVGGGFGNARSTLLNQILNAAPDGNSFVDPNGDSGWSKLFGSPAPTPTLAPNPAQQASMDQFRQLLDPNSAPITAATTFSASASDSATSSKAQLAPPVSDSTQPLVNPIGASFAPLSSGIGEPASLTPLPTITRQAIITPSTAPAWAPQPAPWMSQAPQPFVIPQRKF